MGRLVDRTGMRYGRLTVLYRAPAHMQYRSPSGQTKACWVCRCDCGNEVIVNGSNLESGRTTSCGCYRDETVYSKIRMIHTIRGKGVVSCVR